MVSYVLHGGRGEVGDLEQGRLTGRALPLSLLPDCVLGKRETKTLRLVSARREGRKTEEEDRKVSPGS